MSASEWALIIPLTLVAIVALGVGTVLWAVRELREEGQMWRAMARASLAEGTMLTIEAMVKHRVEDSTLEKVERISRVATIGAPEPVPSRVGRGSPLPEATAERRVEAQSIASLAMWLRDQYAERGEHRSADELAREARGLIDQAG